MPRWIWLHGPKIQHELRIILLVARNNLNLHCITGKKYLHQNIMTKFRFSVDLISDNYFWASDAGVCNSIHCKPSPFDKQFCMANTAIFTLYTTFLSNQKEIFFSQGKCEFMKFTFVLSCKIKIWLCKLFIFLHQLLYTFVLINYIWHFCPISRLTDEDNCITLSLST
jgi:hypothetical protein